MLKPTDTPTIESIMMILIFMLAIGCETQNPVCSENYCVIGAIFPRSEIGDGEFEELPASVDEETVVGLLAGRYQESGAGAGTPPVTSTHSRFVSARPASGSEILPNASIMLTFDKAPTNVTVNPGVAVPFGKTVSVKGPFAPGPLNLTVTWADGTQTLTYTVTAPDIDPPRITGGTVKNGAYVDAEVINTDAKIEVTFSEEVRGHIALQTFGGDDVGWLGEVEGNKGVLELVRDEEIDNGTLYVIVCVVTDAAGNRAEIKTLFHTTGVKRSVVEEPVVPEVPKVSFKDDILPIFRERCQECHRTRPGHTFPMNNLDLTSYKSTIKGSWVNGAVVDPGWSNWSPIVWRINGKRPVRRMPLEPRPPLSEEQIQLIIDWIDEGAENN